MSVIGGRPCAGIGPQIASGAGKVTSRSLFYLNPAVGTGIGLVRPRCPHQVLCHVSLVRESEGDIREGALGRRKGLSKPMGAVARPVAYVAAGAELGPDALAGSARLNPRPSKAVNEHDIGCMIIY